MRPGRPARLVAPLAPATAPDWGSGPVLEAGPGCSTPVEHAWPAAGRGDLGRWQWSARSWDGRGARAWLAPRRSCHATALAGSPARHRPWHHQRPHRRGGRRRWPGSRPPPCRFHGRGPTALEAAALAAAEAGTRPVVVIEPTGPAWLPVAVCFGRRGHTVLRVTAGLVPPTCAGSWPATPRATPSTPRRWPGCRCSPPRG